MLPRRLPMDGSVALALSCPGAPFAANSFWNTPLPANIAANPNNTAYQSDLQYDLCNYFPIESSPTNPCVTPSYGGLNTSEFSVPLYVVPADQPLVPVNAACANPKSGTDFTPSANLEPDILAGGLPIPSDAHGAAGTDEGVLIYQPSTNTEWEAWQFQKDSSGNWQACDAGVNTDVSGSDGVFPTPFGSSASGLSFLGSVVRIEELQRGEIDHPMDLELPLRLSKLTLPANTPGATVGFSWPANRTDGKSTDPSEIPEGQRLQLPSCLYLSNSQTCVSLATYSQTYPLSPVAMTIAVAAQKYGFIVMDGSGDVDIKLGDPTTYTAAGLPDPYTSGPGVGGVGDSGLFDGVQSYLVMENFPWEQLQALPFNYGEPASP
jgi:hypothetical protein